MNLGERDGEDRQQQQHKSSAHKNQNQIHEPLTREGAGGAQEDQAVGLVNGTAINGEEQPFPRDAFANGDDQG